MPKKSPQKTARDRVEAAMLPLAALPEFGEFMELVRQMKDYTVESMVHTTTVASERESLCHKGEVRAYLWFLETHRAQKEQLEEMARIQREQNGQTG